MAIYFKETQKEILALMVTQLSGIQIFITTMIIGYVLLNFLIMFLERDNLK